MREPAAISPSTAGLGCIDRNFSFSESMPALAASNLGKRVSTEYRLNVAQEENRSERVTLLDPDGILDDDRIAIVI
jgi:hypothetical protein